MTENERKKKYVDFMPDGYDCYYEKLSDMGFFSAPASTHYHGAYRGGLFDHSFTVAEELVNLTEKLDLAWDRPEGPYVVGMFHDLCKADQYYFDTFDQKWKYNNQLWLNGHGEKSVILTQRIFDLTEEEVACIRWHMGAYERNVKLWEYYGRAIEKYPNVLYTHTADMIASRIKNI